MKKNSSQTFHSRRSSPGHFCQVISGYYRNDPRVFQRQSKSLLYAGYRVTIATNDGEPDEKVDGIDIRSSSQSYSSRIRTLALATWQFWGLLRDIDADVYQLHSPELLPIAIVLKWRGKVVVYDAHEDLPNHILDKEWIPASLRRPLSFAANLFINAVLSRIDAVVTPHHHVAEALAAVNPMVVVVANHAKMLPFDPYKILPFRSRGSIVCYSGTMYSHSNQKEVLVAIEDLIEVEYHVAGYMPPNLELELQREPAYSRFVFHGRLPWEDLRTFYETSLAGLAIIGFTRNLGGRTGTNAINKFFEYMEAGLPVICSGSRLWREIVEEYKCGICVEPGDIVQIRAAIKTLTEDRDLAELMGRNGRRAIEERFNWSVEEDKFLKIFSDIRLMRAPRNGI
uniref:glycosyltransferase n=1 Tax=Limnohabitans sp. TaxID=1907725 RepID=UPI004047DC4D